MTQHMKALSSTYSGGLGTMPSPTVAGPATPSATSVPVSSPLGPSVQVPGTQTALSYSRPLRPPPPSLSSFEESTWIKNLTLSHRDFTSGLRREPSFFLELTTSKVSFILSLSLRLLPRFQSLGFQRQEEYQLTVSLRHHCGIWGRYHPDLTPPAGEPPLLSSSVPDSGYPLEKASDSFCLLTKVLFLLLLLITLAVGLWLIQDQTRGKTSRMKKLRRNRMRLRKKGKPALGLA